MAIAFNASSDGYKGTIDTTALTVSHTCTGSDLMLIVFPVAIRGNFVTGVTYGGVSMTQFEQWTEPNTNSFYGYYLANPSTGANNIVVSVSNSTEIGLVAGSYTGVSSTIGTDHIDKTNNVAKTSLTNTINMASADAWMVAACGFQREVTASTGAYERRDNATSQHDLFDSNGPVGATGNFSMSYTFPSIGNQAALAVELLPAGFSPTNTTNFFLMM